MRERTGHFVRQPAPAASGAVMLLPRLAVGLVLALSIIVATVPEANAYYEMGHARITQWAVRMLRVEDRDPGTYAEIYHPIYSGSLDAVSPLSHGNKTLIQGAVDEDFGTVAENSRAFRHFYDPTQPPQRRGLAFRDYFRMYLLEGESVTRPQGDYYPDALEWARDSAGTLTLRNWAGALEAYDYSSSSRQEAYWRLGHVLHLVQDMAEPDHATATSHWGSGYSLPDDITVIEQKLGALRYVLPLVRTQLNEWYNRTRLDPTIGFEKFVEEYAIPMQLDAQTALIPGSQRRANLEAYFQEMAASSQQLLRERNISLPVGLRGPQDPHVVPGLLDAARRSLPDERTRQDFDRLVNELYGGPSSLMAGFPAIRRNDPTDVEKFRDVASRLMTQAAQLNAGLLQDFYDLVNVPAFVEGVGVIQGGELKYFAHWRPRWTTVTGIHDGQGANYPFRYTYEALQQREFVVEQNQPIVAGVPATLIVRFGPYQDTGSTLENTISQPVPERVQDVIVTISGTPVAGTMDADGTKWSGEFQVQGVGASGGERVLSLPIGITARDTHPHAIGPNGEQLDRSQRFVLDANPATPARLQAAYGYYWNGYEPGEDRNHAVQVREQPRDESVPRIQSPYLCTCGAVWHLTQDAQQPQRVEGGEIRGGVAGFERRIRGNLEGRVLRFEWFSEQPQQTGGSHGTGMIEFSEDMTRGRWTMTNDGGRSWSGSLGPLRQ